MSDIMWWFGKRTLLGTRGRVFKLPAYFFFPHSTALSRFLPSYTRHQPAYLFSRKCSSSAPSPSSLLLHSRLCPLQFPSKVLPSPFPAMFLLEMCLSLPSLSREEATFPAFTTPATKTLKKSLLRFVSIIFYRCDFEAEYFHRRRYCD